MLINQKSITPPPQTQLDSAGRSASRPAGVALLVERVVVVPISLMSHSWPRKKQRGLMVSSLLGVFRDNHVTEEMEQMLHLILSYPPPTTASSGEEDYLLLQIDFVQALSLSIYYLSPLPPPYLYEGYHENDNIFSKRPAILHMD
eukprot:scaffold2693_cov178-Ochromonas_danica.AAC.4